MMASVLEFLARNWALMSIVPTLLLLAAIPGMIIRKYVGIALNLIDDAAPPVFPEARQTPVDRAEGEAVEFIAHDGHLLRGTVLERAADCPYRGTIIFAHEFGTDRWSHEPYSRGLRKAGYDVFSFDFRGHGGSPGEPGYKPRQWPSDREQADMLGAIAFVEDRLEGEGRAREVGLLGLSRGAGAAILASVGLGHVRAVAVDGAFSSENVVEFVVRRWASLFVKLRFAYEAPPPSYWRFLRWWILLGAERRFGCRFPSVRKALRRIGPKPLLFIHGERDSYIPIEQTQLLYEAASEPKYLWTVPGARHNQGVVQQPQEYARRLVWFFDRHLAGCADAGGPESQTLSDLTQPIDSRAPDVFDKSRRHQGARMSH